MSDPDSFDAGRRGGFAGPSTDMEEFRRGENARRIDLENAKSANTSYWPKDRGGSGGAAGGGGALLFLMLLMGPLVVALSIPSLLSAWILGRLVPVPERTPVPTRWRLFAAAFFTTLATGLPGAVVAVGAVNWFDRPQGADFSHGDLVMMQWLGAVVYLVMMLLAGGLALKLILRNNYPGFAGYLRACLAAIPVGVIAMLFVAGWFAVIAANG
jgi:hypothetical protein